ncbi:MAG: adenylyltransferase/cytidyltransferase family protein [archaeon]
MKKFSRALIKGSFNPFHHGHLELLKTAKELSEKTDIYIGDKFRPCSLPRQIRTETVNANIKSNKWEKYFNVISTGKHSDLNPIDYNLYITGSDLLNILTKTISSKGIKISQKYKDFYLAFPNILIINRPNMPLEQKAKKTLEQHTNTFYQTGNIKTSGLAIRQAYQEGKEIKRMVPKATWEIIRNHTYLFKQGLS